MLRISQTILDQLRRHGEETYPHECCGILLGSADWEKDNRTVTRVLRCGNTRADSPQTRYHIDERELIAAQKQARQQGEDIVGFYHSHPDHPARWSATDLAEAHWLGCSYVITSVSNGKAGMTNSFALAGALEEEKRFADEQIVIEESVAAPLRKA
jgi:proteasome lid subunit RPN8/RPN11